MTLPARYSGTCPECGKAWQPGDAHAAWAELLARVHHATRLDLTDLEGDPT